MEMTDTQEFTRFKYMEHTSEAKFQAYGKTLEEAFGNAVLAMFIKKVKPVKKKEIFIRAGKLDTLLYDFLDEFILLLDTEGLIISKIESIQIKKEKEIYNLHAVILGDNYKSYDVHGDVKAITYNDMMITENRGKFIVQVVVDI